MMKRILMWASAALLLSAPALHAQKLNEEALRSRITKSDQEIADAKKQSKAIVWLNRGKAYYDVANAPSKDIFAGIQEVAVKLNYGDASAREEVTLGREAYTALTYPYLTIYLNGKGMVHTWRVTDPIIEGAIDTAAEAFLKAFELDPKSVDKVREGLDKVVNYYLQEGSNQFSLGEYSAAADTYGKAYVLELAQPIGKVDTALVFNAGYLNALSGNYAKGAEQLEEALKYGYLSDGDIYYLLFHAYYQGGQGDTPKAKAYLLEGVKAFPKNQNILESLMGLYSSNDPTVGSPAEIIDIVNAAIANDPQNPDLWQGKGRICYKLKDWQSAIEAFQKEAELRPDDYSAQLRMGVIYAEYADTRQNEVYEQNYTNQQELDKALEVVNQIYISGIPALERAHELNPTAIEPVEVLKQLYFRFRERPGYEGKYDEYDKLYNELK